jgi:hypothetical protein
VSEFIRKPSYRYSIPLSPDLFVVCFDCVLYPPGPIPAEWGQVANFNLKDLRLSSNQLTGTPSLFPLACLQYEGIDLLSLCPSVPVEYVDLFFVCFEYPGPIPAELANKLKYLRLNDNKLTGTLSPLLPLTCVAYEVGDLPCVSPIVPVG